jgi:hypothetical protein
MENLRDVELTYGNVTKTIKEWAGGDAAKYRRLVYRYKNWGPGDRIFEQPKQKRDHNPMGQELINLELAGKLPISHDKNVDRDLMDILRTGNCNDLARYEPKK